MPGLARPRPALLGLARGGEAKLSQAWLSWAGHRKSEEVNVDVAFVTSLSQMYVFTMNDDVYSCCF